LYDEVGAVLLNYLHFAGGNCGVMVPSRLVSMQGAVRIKRQRGIMTSGWTALD